MRIKYIFNALSLILKYMSAILLIPVLVALYYKDGYSFLPYLVTLLVIYVISMTIKSQDKKYNNFDDLTRTEGLAIVALSWMIFSLVGSLVYVFYGLSPINALFESTSGFTTTGATTLNDFSIYPKTMFFWRSLTQWFGGMGVIVLFVAILPQFAVAGRQLFFAESTGPIKDKITPRIKNTALTLWAVYFILTILQIACLKIAGMGLFDSVCHSFATISAGGFSPKQESIAAYNYPKFIWIFIVFMFLASINFALQYKVFFKKQFNKILKNEEFIFFTSVVLFLSFCLAIALIINQHLSLWASVRESLFQILSVISSSGFATMDFAKWNTAEKVFLFATAMIGGCAGSAAGGVKAVRVLFAFKFLKREIAKLVHPQGVFAIKIDRKIVPEDVGAQILSFIVFYIVICVVTSIIATVIESDVIVGMTGAITTLGNIGPGFAEIGPMNSFDSLHTATKIVFIMNMLVGRLELVPFLIFLHPDLWKIKKC